MKKYQPENNYGDYLKAKLKITSIVRINIEEMVGKEDLGKGKVREHILKVLQENKPLPVVI